MGALELVGEVLEAQDLLDPRTRWSGLSGRNAVPMGERVTAEWAQPIAAASGAIGASGALAELMPPDTAGTGASVTGGNGSLVSVR